MGGQKNTAEQEFGFNPAWWMGAAIAFLLTAIVGDLTSTLNIFWVCGFVAIGIICTAVGFTGVVHGRGFVLQSPLRLSADERARSTTIDLSYAVSLLVTAFLIFEIGTFVGETKLEESKPSVIDQYKTEQEKKTRDEKQIPEPFSTEDQAILKKGLTVDDLEKGQYRFQIIREEDDRSRKFADSLSLVLKKSKWIETTPTSGPAPGYPLPLGITIRCGTVSPADSAGNSLTVSLRQVGLHPDYVEDATLRAYDYVIIYVSDHGYLPKE